MNKGRKQRCLFCSQRLPNHGMAIHLGRVHREELLRAVSIGDIYRNFNGGREEVLHVGRLVALKLGRPDEEIAATVVITRALDAQPQYGAGSVFVRRMVNFLERFDIEGQLVPRFKLIQSSPSGHN